VGWEFDLELSASELREEIAPTAVSKKKQASLPSISGSQLQSHVQLGILMVSVGTFVDAAWIESREPLVTMLARRLLFERCFANLFGVLVYFLEHQNKIEAGKVRGEEEDLADTFRRV